MVCKLLNESEMGRTTHAKTNKELISSIIEASKYKIIRANLNTNVYSPKN